MPMDKINHTQISNDFIDKFMSELSGAETKIFLAIARKTIGWHKDIDKISISQIKNLTGLSKTQIVKSCKLLREKGILIITGNERQISNFEINYSGLKSEPDVLVQKVNQPGTESEPEMPKSGTESEHTKERIKETFQKKEISLFNEIKNYFIDNNPNYYHNGKHAKHIKNLMKWSNDNYDKIKRLADKHLEIKKVEKKDKFWVNSPHEPATIMGKLGQILEYKFDTGDNQDAKSTRSPEEEERLRKQKEAFLNGH